MMNWDELKMHCDVLRYGKLHFVISSKPELDCQ